MDDLARKGAWVLSESGRLFYRIVLSDPPTRRDFVSNVAQGKAPPRDDLETRRLWAGISVYDTRRRARQQARHMPWLGAFIAVVRISRDGPVVAERTTNSHGHYTLWGDPDALLACVTEVFPIGEQQAR